MSAPAVKAPPEPSAGAVAQSESTGAELVKLSERPDDREAGTGPADEDGETKLAEGDEADCGKRGAPPQLSMARVRRVVGKMHPRDTDGSLLSPWKLQVGSLSSADDTQLLRYGVGITLYFKSLRYFVRVMFLLSLLSIPAALFFYKGGAFNKETEGTFARLAIFSAGNLGTGTVIGGQYAPGDLVVMQCGAGVISKVSAFYGTPKGVYGCPAEQQPRASTGACPASHGPDGSCSSFCFIGSDPTANTPCCAPRRTGAGLPDFSDIEVRRDEGCHSASAGNIVRGLCLGKASCNFTVSETQTYSWPITPRTGCTNTTAGSIATQCTGETFGGPGLEQCQGTKRLILLGRCIVPTVDFLGQKLDKDVVAFVVSSIDCVFAIAFVAAVWYMHNRERALALRLDERMLTVKDFSVFIPQLPTCWSPKETVEQLKSLLQQLVNNRRYERKVYGWSAREDIRVADVVVSFKAQERLIKLFTERGALLGSLEQALNKLRVLQDTLDFSSFKDAAKFDKVIQERTKAVTKIDEIDAIISELEGKDLTGPDMEPRSAFVTFEYEEGARRAVNVFEEKSTFLRSLCCKTGLKLGNGRISVLDAPEASDVRWPNLGASAKTRRYRVGITNLATLVLLLLSFLFITVAKTQQAKLQRMYPSIDCEPYPDLTPEDVVRDEHPEQRFDNRTSPAGTRRGLLHCFCLSNSLTSEFAAPPFQGVDSVPSLPPEFWTGQAPQYGASAQLCLRWAEQQLYVQGANFGAAGGIVLVNLILKQGLNWFVRMERQPSSSAELASVALKLAVAQIVNTAVIVLAVDANLALFNFEVPSLVPNLPLLAGRYSEFTSEWYRDVGVAIATSIVIQGAVNVVMPLFQMFLQRLRQCRDRGCTRNQAVTRCTVQTKLEALYIGPDFELAQRYAAILTIVYACLLFSSGMPYMNWICLGVVLSVYFVDRWLFCRFYRTPPNYSHRLALAASGMLRWAGVAHLVFGAWMFSNDDIFPPSDSLISVATSETTMLTSSAGNFGGIRNLITYVPHVTAVAAVLLFVMFFYHLLWRHLGHFFCNPEAAGEGEAGLFDATPTDVLTELFQDPFLVKSELAVPYIVALRKRADDRGDADLKRQLAQYMRAAGVRRASIKLDDLEGAVDPAAAAAERRALESDPASWISGPVSYSMSASQRYRVAFGLNVVTAKDYRRDLPCPTSGDVVQAELQLRASQRELETLRLQRDLLAKQLSALETLESSAAAKAEAVREEVWPKIQQARLAAIEELEAHVLQQHHPTHAEEKPKAAASRGIALPIALPSLGLRRHAQNVHPNTSSAGAASAGTAEGTATATATAGAQRAGVAGSASEEKV